MTAIENTLEALERSVREHDLTTYLGEDSSRALLEYVRALEATLAAAQPIADAFVVGGGGLVLAVGGVEAERRIVALKEALSALDALRGKSGAP